MVAIGLILGLLIPFPVQSIHALRQPQPEANETEAALLGHLYTPAVPGPMDLDVLARDPHVGLEENSLVDLVANLALGAEVRQQLADAIDSTSPLAGILSEKELPRTYWRQMLEDYLRQFPDPHRALVELVTNAVDAVNRTAIPKRVDIIVSEGEVQVVDEGVGMGLDDKLKYLLTPGASVSTLLEYLIGRFGVGFLANLLFLEDERDALIVESATEGGAAHRLVLFRKAGELQFRFDPPESQARGTRITVRSRQIDADMARRTLRQNLQFHPKRTATLVLDNSSVINNVAMHYVGTHPTSGVSVLYSEQKASQAQRKGTGYIVATVKGVIFFVLPVPGLELPTATVIDFSASTPFPVARNTIEVGPGTLQSVQDAIGVIQEALEANPQMELLLLTALQPLVARIQALNPSRFAHDDIEKALNRRLERLFSPSFRYVPDDAAGHSVSGARSHFVGSNILSDQALKQLQDDSHLRLPFSTDRPVVLTPFRESGQVLAVSDKVVFWNKEHEPRKTMDYVACRACLEAHGVKTSPLSSQEENRPVTRRRGALAQVSDVGVALAEFLEGHNWRQQIVHFDDGAEAEFFDDFLVDRPLFDYFASEVSDDVLVHIHNELRRWDNQEQASRALHWLVRLSQASPEGLTEHDAPVWSEWTEDQVLTALEVARSALTRGVWDFSIAYAAQFPVRDLMRAAFISRSLGSGYKGWLLHRARAPMQRGYPVDRAGDYTTNWVDAFALPIATASNTSFLVRDASGWIHTIALAWGNADAWGGQGAPHPLEAYGHPDYGRGSAVHDFLAPVFKQAMDGFKSRGVPPQVVGEFILIARAFWLMAKRHVDEDMARRYYELWFNAQHGLLSREPAAYSAIVRDMRRMVSIHAVEEQPPVLTQRIHALVHYVMGTGDAQTTSAQVQLPEATNYTSTFFLSAHVADFFAGTKRSSVVRTRINQLNQLTEEATESVRLAQRLIRHAVGLRSATPHVEFQDWFEHASARAVVGAGHVASIHAGTQPGEKVALEYRAPFEMSLDYFLNGLLIPLFRPQFKEEGPEIPGLHTLLKSSEVVYFEFPVSSGTVAYGRIKPIQDEKNQVYDAQVSIATRRGRAQGIRMQTLRVSPNAAMEVVALQGFAARYGRHVDPDRVQLTWNDEALNQPRVVLAEQAGAVIALEGAESVLTHNGRYLGPLRFDRFFEGVPSSAVTILQERGVELVLPADSVLVRDQTDLFKRGQQLQAMQSDLNQLAMQATIASLREDDQLLEHFPFEAVSGAVASDDELPEVDQAVARIASDEPVDYASYLEEERFHHLLVRLPLFSVEALGTEPVSLRAIFDALAGRQISSEQLPAGLRERLSTSAVYQAQLAFAVSPTSDAALSVDHRVQSSNGTSATDIFLRLAQSFVARTELPLPALPEQFVYASSESWLARVSSDGHAISWNFGVWAQTFELLDRILNDDGFWAGSYGQAEPEAHNWMFHYVNTLLTQLSRVQTNTPDVLVSEASQQLHREWSLHLVRNSRLAVSWVLEERQRLQSSLEHVDDALADVAGRSERVGLEETLAQVRGAVEQSQRLFVLDATQLSDFNIQQLLEVPWVAQRVLIWDPQSRLVDPPSVRQVVVGDVQDLAYEILAIPVPEGQLLSVWYAGDAWPQIQATVAGWDVDVQPFLDILDWRALLHALGVPEALLSQLSLDHLLSEITSQTAA